MKELKSPQANGENEEITPEALKFFSKVFSDLKTTKNDLENEQGFKMRHDSNEIENNIKKFLLNIRHLIIWQVLYSDKFFNKNNTNHERVSVEAKIMMKIIDTLKDESNFFKGISAAAADDAGPNENGGGKGGGGVGVGGKKTKINKHCKYFCCVTNPQKQSKRQKQSRKLKTRRIRKY